MAMKIEQFTDTGTVRAIIKELKSQGVPSREYSDIVDEAGHQYVDLVQEGGGVLGIALAGYTYVLEQMGLRFHSLAGTSAGAINAMMLAALGRPEEPKSEKALEELANQDLKAFVDGPGYVRKAIDGVLDGKRMSINPVWWMRLYRTYKHLKKHQGLNPGDAFERWVMDVLARQNIHSTGDLMRRRAELPNLFRRTTGGELEAIVEPSTPGLVLIAAEVSTESRIQFPEMNALYWEEPDVVQPARYVRASMSVPAFFYPLRIPVPKAMPGMKNRWEEEIRFGGELPDTAVFVDGGVLSNFPIDVFHVDRMPAMPTFGIRLGPERDQAKNIKSLRKLVAAMFNSARHILDFEFILRHPDYEHLVSQIDVGEHNWLDFGITDSAKVDLFERGAQQARDFLLKFNWEDYKKLRRRLMAATD